MGYYVLIGVISFGVVGLLVFFIRQATKNEFEKDLYHAQLEDEKNAQIKDNAISADTAVSRKLLSNWLSRSKVSRQPPKPLP